MKKLNSLIILLMISTSLCYSQDTVSAKYFPMNLGNVWVYYVQTFPPLQIPYYVYKLERDTIINGHKYFLYNGYHYVGLFSSEWIRYDSLTSNLLIHTLSGGCSNYSNDKILDSLRSSVGNILICQYNAYLTRKCTEISTSFVFNTIEKPSIKFEHDGLVLQYVTYARDFGIIYSASGEPPPVSSYQFLKGCIIAGVVYGDTTLTSVSNIRNELPGNFSLSQNYPNPFNPVAKINFELRITNYVSLKVYDALGKEVATLVNEKLPAGSYEVEFDGSNFPSGVYFYKLVVSGANSLSAGNFSETKRMILLK